MASIRTHNNNARRAYHRKTGQALCLRQGLCPSHETSWAREWGEYGHPMHGYRTYRRAHK